MYVHRTFCRKGLKENILKNQGERSYNETLKCSFSLNVVCVCVPYLLRKVIQFPLKWNHLWLLTLIIVWPWYCSQHSKLSKGCSVCVLNHLRRDFPHLSRPDLRPTHNPVQWVPGHGVATHQQLTPRWKKGWSYASASPTPPHTFMACYRVSFIFDLNFGQTYSNFTISSHAIKQHSSLGVFV